MRCSSLSFFIVAILLVISAASVKASASDIHPGLAGADTPEGRKIISKLATIIIPKVDFDKFDIANAVDFLNIKSKELDPDHAGIKFVLVLPRQQNSNASRIHREISMTLENISLGDLLNEIIAQAGLGYRIINDRIVMQPL